MSFLIKQPENEDEFKNYYHLRWKLLRAPWNQAEGSEVDDMEAQCIHLIAVYQDSHQVDNPVIGIARLQFNNDSEAQLRYMAVAEPYRTKGIGRELVNVAELQAKRHTDRSAGCKMVLDARESAVGFYQKLGYEIIEKSYLLFDEIQHFRMVKDL